MIVTGALLLTVPGMARAAFSFSNGVVTDSRTGLQWQQQDDGQTRNWEGAISYCEGLPLAGHNDWRLPNVKELESITDDSRYTPAIDPVFTSTAASNYWSSTTYAVNSGNAWIVHFSYGYVYDGSKSDFASVRCVRGGQ